MPANHFIVEVCLFDYNEDIASHNTRFDSFPFHSIPHSIWYICWRVNCEAVQKAHTHTNHTFLALGGTFQLNLLQMQFSSLSLMQWLVFCECTALARARKMSKWKKKKKKN